MKDSARNRANGFETMDGGRSNTGVFGTGGGNMNFHSGGKGTGTSGLKLLGVILIVIALFIVAFNSAYKIGEQELNEYGMRCADVNHDGSITVRDATLIQMKLAKYDVDF